MAKQVEKEEQKLTPLMAQYFKLKAKHPDALLLYRVGDFYETFADDAVKTADALGIILTKRNNGGSDIALAGFPYHSLELYLPRLVKAGYRVAICEQLEKPSKEKKIVDRGVTDVITPGLTTEDSLLDVRKNNYLASLHFNPKGIHGLAFLDISTGEFIATEGNVDHVRKMIDVYSPSEIIHSKAYGKELIDKIGDRYYFYALEEWIYTPDYTREKLLDLFKVQNLKGFGVEEMQLGQVAAGAILHYLQATQNKSVNHINQLQRIPSEHFVWLDRFTIRNLELVHHSHDNGLALIDVLDQTSSPMGSRLLKKWILMPLLDAEQIAWRQNYVQYFVDNIDITLGIDQQVKAIGDLERIISKVSLGRVNPRELLSLYQSLQTIIDIKQTLTETKNDGLFKRIIARINDCQFVIENIEKAINPNAPSVMSKGDVIKPHYNTELDELKYIIKNSKDLLLEIQQKEIERTGISNLKIGFNNVFGYFLEVTNKHKDNENIPAYWTRKQTLANAERYITNELKILEDKILHAEEKIATLEEKLFLNLIGEINAFVIPIQENAKVIAEIDCLLSFAKVASKNNYCRPTIDQSYQIDLKESRHPVIEMRLGIEEKYIPNDIFLDNGSTQIMMITGPNMSGKSAVLRQTALIVLMAQIGSFVPAEAATIGIVDKIFTRVGASDNISSGESTFMLEMNETASIMNNVSDRSLILLDEIGRGTSTYDGISIAWSLAEYLHNNDKCRPKTLFATHYHELNDLAEKYPRIINYHVATKELAHTVLFLRKLEKGGSEHSFGIHVAAMAGMPKSIIQRAQEILVELEQKSIDGGKKDVKSVKAPTSNIMPTNYQLSIFETVDPSLGKIKEELSQLEINAMTPIECMMKLNELKKILMG